MSTPILSVGNTTPPPIPDPPATQLYIGRTIFVDSNGLSYGNDSTALRATDRAFATLANALAVAQAGDTIQFRPGNHSWSAQTISVANLTIIADGVTFTKTSITGTNFLTIAATATGFKIRGATFDGNRGGTVGTAFANNLLKFDTGAHDGVVENCRFINNAGHALRADGTQRLRVQGCYFSNNFGDIWAEDTLRTHIRGNSFGGNINSDQYSGAIKLKANTFVAADHVITDNIIKGPGQMGIEPFGGARGGVVANNTVNGTHFGISIGAFASHWLVTGNYLKANYYCGLEFAADTSDHTATGNHFDAFDDAGVLTTGTHPTGAAISITVRTSNIVIDGGTINEYGRYAISMFDTIGNVTVKNLRVKPLTNSLVFVTQLANNITFEDCIIEAPSSGGIRKAFWFQSGTIAGEGGFTVKGNIVLADITENFAQFFSYSGGTFTTARILNNFCTDTLFNDWAVGWNVTPPTTLIQAGNYPTTTDLATGQLGFFNSETFTGLTMTGPLSLPGVAGINRFSTGTASGATSTNYTSKLRLDHGLAVSDHNDVVRMVYDARTGILRVYGNGNGYNFHDRTTGREYAWYADGGKCYLFDNGINNVGGLGNLLSIDTSGNMKVLGTVTPSVTP